MMARLTRKEVDLKIDALEIADEEFVAEGNDEPSYDQITDRANKREEIKACKEPIGAKTLAQSKNKRIVKLREKIQSRKRKISELKAYAPTELTIKIEQLHSSLEGNSILAKKLEESDKKLKRRDEMLEDKDIIISNLSKEIEMLRNDLRQSKE